MRCVLHIGTEKTATTTLQEFVYSNREALLKCGVCLSDVLGKTNNRKLVAYFQPYLDDYYYDNMINSEEKRQLHFDGFVEAFEKEIATLSSKADVLFITSEHFHSRLQTIESISRLKGFLEQFFESITVICYFREQSAVAASLYSTSIKNKNYDDIASFVKKVVPTNHYYNYASFISKWKEVFGKENIVPKIFSTDRFYEKDIRKDLLHLIKEDINLDDFNFDLPASNESLGLIGLEMGRIVNRLFPRYLADGSLNTLREPLIKLISDSELSSLGSINYPQAMDIYLSFNDSNISLAKEYFGFEGNPFSPPSIQASQELLPNSGELVEYFYKFFEEFLCGLKKMILVNENNAEVIRDIALSFGGKSYYQALKNDLFVNDSDADTLRDIALSIEKVCDHKSLKNAFLLMEMAHRVRPDGPFIKKKIDEYKKRLNEESE